MRGKSILASRRATVPQETASNSNRQKGMHFASEERGEPKMHTLSPLMHLLNSARPHPAVGSQRLEEPATGLGTRRMMTGMRTGTRRTWRRGAVDRVQVRGEHARCWCGSGRRRHRRAGAELLYDGLEEPTTRRGRRSAGRRGSAVSRSRSRRRGAPATVASDGHLRTAHLFPHELLHLLPHLRLRIERDRGAARGRARRGACVVAAARAPPPPPSPPASHRRGSRRARVWGSSTASALTTGGERVGPGGAECVCVCVVGDRLFCFANGAVVREAKLPNASFFAFSCWTQPYSI
jgi:hypothetical protein